MIGTVSSGRRKRGYAQGRRLFGSWLESVRSGQTFAEQSRHAWYPVDGNGLCAI